MSAVAFDVYTLGVSVPLNISSEEANCLGDKLASTRKASKTDAAHRALVRDLEREERSRSLAERLQPVLDEIAAAPKTVRETDKAFYDDLSGNM